MSDSILLVGVALFALGMLGFIFWRAWIAFTPRGVALYFAMWGFLAVAGVCLHRCTWPSSAPRLQAEGEIVSIVTHGSERSESYTLSLLLPGGAVLPFRASPLPPFFAEGRDRVVVTYLDEKVTGEYPRAIGFHVLTGSRAGWSDAVSADWFGPWLGVLIGPICAFAALWKAYGNKREKQRGAQE